MGTNYLGIEAGGTKVVCGIGTGPADLSELHRIPTTDPTETLGAVCDYIRANGGDAAAIGLATFGPVDLRTRSATYGHLTTTPKPGWAGADLLGPIRQVFHGPIGLDTDVNGAALGELRWGAGVGLDSLVYVTVGTGIGGGAVINGRPVQGLLHPEMGHILPRRHPDDPFPGRCPTHGDCLEGLACGPAWLERWGAPSDELPAATRELGVAIQAHYLAQLVVSLVLTISPERIVLGGGVMDEPTLRPATRAKAVELLAGYVDHPQMATMEDYLVAPGLGGRAGVLGAIALATDAAGA